MPESYVELARRGYEAALRGDFEVLRDTLAADVKWHGGDPTAEGACRNRTEAVELIRRAYEQRAIGQLVDVIGRGDKVVVILRPPAEPGAPGRVVANLSTFKDGKVIEMVAYADPADALAELADA